MQTVSFLRPPTRKASTGNSYVYNNPLNATDPSGHCPWCIGAAVGFVVGAVADYAYQVHLNMTEGGMGFSQALTTDISFKEILIAGGAGAVTGGTFGFATGVAAAGGIAGSTAGTLASGVVSSPPTGVHGLGGSFSFNLDGSPLANIEGNMGAEIVWNGNTNELTGFGILGWDVSVGPQEGFVNWQKRLWSDQRVSPINYGTSLYYANIHNVKNAVRDYSGVFNYGTKTISTSYGGFTFGKGGNLVDGNLAPSLPYAHTIGNSVGWGATINGGKNYYYPLFSASSNNLSVFPNFQEHIQNTGSLWLP